MKRKFHLAIIAIFLTLFVFFLVFANLKKPRVFVLHSYALDYSWVRDINVGIERILNDQNYAIRWHYMDTKRHPEKDFILKAGNIARRVIESWGPDVIIAIDDNAQEYVARYFLEDPSIKIVFTGVNAEASKYGYDRASNVTGVIERIPFDAFRDVFLEILPEDKRRVVHVSDSSPTSQGIYKELETVNWYPLELVESIRSDTLDQWKAAVEHAPKIADVLLVTHYHTIRESAEEGSPVVFPPKVMAWTKENSKLPTIGAWGFFVEDGGMMAVAVSPYEQGEEAAKMTVNIITKHQKPTDIPQQTSQLYLMYINEKNIRANNIKLPTLFEAFARATNTYFE